jgi:hypothetical protein
VKLTFFACTRLSQRESLEGLPLGEFQNMLVHKNATNMIGYGKTGACSASNTPTQVKWVFNEQLVPSINFFISPACWSLFLLPRPCSDANQIAHGACRLASGS